ncbi:MAG: hemerythrin domain-containing protein [Planctomycetota bacterium]
MKTSSVATRRLTVNAAFLKDIKDDNRDLKMLIQRLKRLTHPREVAGNHWAELLRLMGDFRDQLAMHFGLEEAYGYFDAAIDTEPERSVLAESLRMQHRDLFEQARHLAEQAEKSRVNTPAESETIEGQTPELTPSQERLLDRLQALMDDFEQHEEAELNLILDSLDQDLGVGD